MLRQIIPQAVIPSCFSVLIMLRCILEAEGLVMVPNENPICDHFGTNRVLSNCPNWKIEYVCQHNESLSGIQRFTRVLEVFDLQSFKIIPHGVAVWLSVVR